MRIHVPYQPSIIWSDIQLSHDWKHHTQRIDQLAEQVFENLFLMAAHVELLDGPICILIGKLCVFESLA